MGVGFVGSQALCGSTNLLLSLLAVVVALLFGGLGGYYFAAEDN